MKLEKQITNEELLELTKKAFENNEVAEFLCGEKGYACPISHFVPANVPTDFSRIIDFGVYKLYEKTKNEKIVAKFEEAILYLLDWGCKKKFPRKKAAILPKSKTAVFFCGIIKVS